MTDMKQYKVGRKPNYVICDDTPDVWFKPEVVIEIIGDDISNINRNIKVNLRFFI